MIQFSRFPPKFLLPGGLLAVILCSLSLLPTPANAQSMSKKQCQAADWIIIGAKDALEGRGPSSFAVRRDKCAKRDLPANADEWDEGYYTMTAWVCEPIYAYGLGEQRKDFRVDCPPEGLDETLRAYEIGLDYGNTRRRYDAAREDYNNDVRAINAERSSIQSAQRRLAKKDLEPDDVQKQINRIENSRKRINQLENGLNYKRSLVDSAERDYERVGPQAKAFRRRLTPLYPDEFDDLIAVTGRVVSGDKGRVSLFLQDAGKPLYFAEASLTLDDFRQAFQVNTGEKKCKVQRKVRRAISQKWKKLRKQPITASVHTLHLIPPTYDTSVRATFKGSATLGNGQDLATSFVEEGLAVRDGQPPLASWFKKKDCIAYVQSIPPVVDATTSSADAPEPSVSQSPTSQPE